MKYNKGLLNRFLTEKVAIALRTQEEWNEFMQLLEKETDLRWLSGKKPTELNYWKEYREETAIKNNSNIQGVLKYCHVSYYKIDNYEIIEFKELVKEKEMNLADKLRFLADRWEDGKEFYMGSLRYSLNKGGLVMLPPGIQSNNEINDLKGADLKLAPQWEFTEDEKVILRNLPDNLHWITRDEDDCLYVFTKEPSKASEYWEEDTGCMKNIAVFNHIFQSIQWSDEEPCEFRKYI